MKPNKESVLEPENSFYTDIHCHILYGVDDGSPDKETSMEMLRMAYKEGIRKIILTPHYKPNHHNASPDRIDERLGVLKELLQKEGVDITLYPGNELLYFDEAVHLLNAGVINTMAYSRYVLTEFMPRDDYTYIKSALYGLLSGGYLPILAHIERYECMMSDLDGAYELKRMGIYIQVNAGSVEGKYGRAAKKYTRTLLEDDVVDFVASDAHNTKSRAPEFNKCIKYMEKKLGEETVKRIMTDNPRAVLEDKYI